MSAGEARILVDHRSPCSDLNRARDNIDKLFDKVDDPETGLGALNRSARNSTAWQERLEARVNQLYYIALAAALSGAASLLIGLALLLMGKGK